MSDTPVHDHDDRVDDVEALLRQLTDDDFVLDEPPADLWAGIDAAVAAESAHASGNVVSLADRRSRRLTRLLAAAAAVVMVAVGAVAVVAMRGGDDAVLATAALTFDADAFDPLGAESSATAALVEADGAYSIRIDDAVLPDPGADDLELWLIAVGDDGALDVQPVSLIDAAEPGTYLVPAGLDPTVHSIVDISIEPRDGDETHSGRSILRGTLDV